MKDRILKISSIIGVCFIAFVFVFSSISVVNARADVLLAYKTYTAGAVHVSVDPASNFNIYNSGASFVIWGQMSGTGNVIVFVDVNGNGASFKNNTMKLEYRSGNVNNAIGLISFGIYANDILYPDNNDIFYYGTDDFITNFDILSGNEYFIDLDTSNIRFEFTFALPSNTYAEFSFNDFLVSFYSNVQFQDAYNLGYQDAYDSYYNSRYNNGYADGFNAGAADRYSFFSLISAAIDVPLNAGLNLLNFEFLGFNMKGFFLSLFTVALILTVIRFVLGRR